MSYALATLWHERQRFLPAVLAIGFSALLIAMQCGLLLGMFSFASIPVDRARADVWVGSPYVTSVDMGRPIRASRMALLLAQPDVTAAETCLLSFAFWRKPVGGEELCIIIGCRLEQDSLACPPDLTAELRDRLSEPGTVVMDDSDLDRLGVRGVGDLAEINQRRIRIVGLTHGLRGIAGAYVYCSFETARMLLRLHSGQTTYLLARCTNIAAAERVAQKIGQTDTLSAFTSGDLSRRSQVHWLLKTKAGLALGLAAALGLVVGAVVTSQTLAAATAASLREYAVLWALGIPRARMAMAVLAQAGWVGIAGNALAIPIALTLAAGADRLGIRVLVPAWLLAATAVVTLTVALLSGLAALRTLRRLQPSTLLR